MKVFNLKVNIEPSEDGGFVAECPSLQGCYTSGLTFDEAVAKIREAIRLHIEDRIEDGDPIPSEVDLSETVETVVSVSV